MAKRCDSLCSHFRVSRSVGHKNAVILLCVRSKVVVVWDNSQLDSLVCQVSDDVVLDATVDCSYARSATFVENTNGFGAHFRHEIARVWIVKFYRILLKLDLAEHGAALAQHLGDHAGVDTAECWDIVVTEPVAQRLLGCPVRVPRRVLTDDKASDVYAVTLEVLRQAIVVPHVS